MKIVNFIQCLFENGTTFVATKPFSVSITPNITRSPAYNVRVSSRCIPERWTKIPLPPFSGVMIPIPWLSLNHLTFPITAKQIDKMDRKWNKHTKKRIDISSLWLQFYAHKISTVWNYAGPGFSYLKGSQLMSES